MRLFTYHLSEYVPCPWCSDSEEMSAKAQSEAVHKYQFLRYEGFHCAAHAEQMHALAQLDENMHFNCCEQVFLTETNDFSIVANDSGNDE